MGRFRADVVPPPLAWRLRAGGSRQALHSPVVVGESCSAAHADEHTTRLLSNEPKAGHAFGYEYKMGNYRIKAAAGGLRRQSQTGSRR